MKRENSSERAYRHKALIADLIECECFYAGEESLDDYDEAIADCLAMIDHFVDLRNEEEVAFWRSMLQQTKIEKRHAQKRMIDKKNGEVVYS